MTTSLTDVDVLHDVLLVINFTQGELVEDVLHR